MRKLIGFFSGIIMAFSLSCEAQTVTPEEFEKGFKEKQAQLLDVRTPEEFESGHISDAMLANINEKEEFNRRLSALDKEKPVYVYCLSGGRSHKAAEDLRNQGFKEVVELDGGINAWKNAGLPVAGKSKVPLLSEKEYLHMVSDAPVVLVDFGAPWCPPCRKMEPVISQLEKEYKGKVSIIKIDGGSQSELMKNRQITAMPGFILYRNGKEIWRTSGVAEKSEFEENFAKALTL